MSRICLVMRRADGPGVAASSAVDALRDALSNAGHEVQLSIGEELGEPEQWPWSSGARGVAAGTAAAWAKTGADVLLSVDESMAYRPRDVVRAVERVVDDPETVVIGSRYGVSASAPRRAVGKLLGGLTGSADPLSGLVCLSAGKFRRVALGLQPAGRSMAPEFLLKCAGSTVDLAVEADRRRGPWPRELEQVKQLKRLTNQRLGNISRLAQFCMVGFSGMLVDLAAFALLGRLLTRGPLGDRVVEFAGKPIDLGWVAAAGASISMALVWNFVLNRQFTFSDARRNSGLVRQFLTYLLGNAVAVSLSFLLRVGLPAWFVFFRDQRVAAAIVGVVLATGVSFSMSRWLVFRTRPATKAVDAPKRLARRGVAARPEKEEAGV